MNSTLNIGLLSDNKDLLDAIYDNVAGANIILYKSIDVIKREEFSILLIDCNIFETFDSAQFLLSKIRKKIHETPVILIISGSALSSINSEWFFHDFVIIPFRDIELFIRITRLLKLDGIDENLISIGHVQLNIKEYSVYLRNQKLELTYKEFEILRLLVENKGEVFSRKDLLNKIWGMEYIGGTRTVDVHIRRLRGKLGEEFNSIIETVRNVGYRCKD